MDDILLLKKIKELSEKEGKIEKEDKDLYKDAIKQFRKNNYDKILNYVQDKITDKTIIQISVDRSFDWFITAITKFDFEIENYLKSLKNLALLTFYQQQLLKQFLHYLNDKPQSNYISMEGKIRKRLFPFIQSFLQSYDLDKFSPAENPYFQEKKLIFDWMNNSAIDVYIHKTLGDENPISMNELNKIVRETYCLFVMRYSLNENLVNVIQHEVESTIRKQPPFLRSDKIIVREHAEILSDTNLRFLEKIKAQNFVLKTSFVRFWQGMLKYIQQETPRGGTDNEKAEIKQKKRDAQYDNQAFVKEEVMAFINEGLEYVEDMKNGKAHKLLLKGRNSNFIQIIKEALGFHDDMFKDEKIIKGFDDSLKKYRNQSVENEQRKDCKKALINWMKDQANNAPNAQERRKLIQMIEFICHKKFSEL